MALLTGCSLGAAAPPASSEAGTHPVGRQAASPLAPGGGKKAKPEPVPDAPNPDPAHLETAILAGGCFWGMEEILRTIPGVVDTEVGYAGGTTPFPTYQDVSTGRTGHAESVRVRFDPTKLSFADLLEKWFFRMHDPTTLNRQGNDRGTQYRSAIFATTPEQKRVAREVILRVDASKKWGQRVVTEVVDATGFTPAEGYHQDYLQKNPGGYTCHYLRD